MISKIVKSFLYTTNRLRTNTSKPFSKVSDRFLVNGKFLIAGIYILVEKYDMKS